MKIKILLLSLLIIGGTFSCKKDDIISPPPSPEALPYIFVSTGKKIYRLDQNTNPATVKVIYDQGGFIRDVCLNGEGKIFWTDKGKDLVMYADLDGKNTGSWPALDVQTIEFATVDGKDYIYLAPDFVPSVYRMEAYTGENPQLIFSDNDLINLKIRNIQIGPGNYIYYGGTGNDDGLFRRGIDGKNREKEDNSPSPFDIYIDNTPAIPGKGVFYVGFGPFFKTFRQGFNDGEAKVEYLNNDLDDVAAPEFDIDDNNYLYYINSKDEVIRVDAYAENPHPEKKVVAQLPQDIGDISDLDVQ